MRRAIQAGDVAALKDQTHKLKGRCLTLAATRTAELCRQLENHAAAGSLDGAIALLDQIEAAFAEAHSALLMRLPSNR